MLHIDFIQFKEAFLNAINFPTRGFSNDFIKACEEASSVMELEDEIAQWIPYCKGNPEKAASWILNLVLENKLLE